MDACNGIWSRLAVGGTALIFALSVLGCEKAHWDDPQYINEQLKKGDPTTRTLAINKVEELEDKEQQEKTVPGLVETYMAEGTNKKGAMKILVKLRHPDAKKAYLKEVRTDGSGFAGAAARALGTIKATDAIGELVKMYESTRDTAKKQAILEGFTHMPDPKMIGALVDTLYLNVDNYPIALHSYSCDILGDIGQEHPEAFEESQLRALVRAQFVANEKGQSINTECGLAIQKIGAPMVPLLLELFRGENQEVLKLMQRYRQDDPNFTPNRPKVAAIQRLVSLRTDKAVDPFLADLKKEKEVPEDLPDDKAVRSAYFKFEAQSIDEMLLGLGEMQAESAYDMLVEALTGERNETWKAVLDPLLELQLRQDAGKALVRLGNREATEPLFKMAKDGQIEKLESRAKALVKAGRKPMNPMQRYQFNWMSTKSWANLSNGSEADLKRLQALIDRAGKRVAAAKGWKNRVIENAEKRKEKAEKEEDKKKAEKFLEQAKNSGKKLVNSAEKLEKRYKSFKPMLELAGKCLEKGSDNAKGSCFAEALDSDNEYKREKAVWEISRLSTEVAGPLLAEHISTDNLGTRETIETALYANPHKSAIDAIDALLEDESGQSSERYELDHNRLKLLRAWLKNNV